MHAMGATPSIGGVQRIPKRLKETFLCVCVSFYSFLKRVLREQDNSKTDIVLNQCVKEKVVISLDI